jgi:prepilin signal peptidase PulO-like enzyme (type II secretory pathway)
VPDIIEYLAELLFVATLFYVSICDWRAMLVPVLPILVLIAAGLGRAAWIGNAQFMNSVLGTCGGWAVFAAIAGIWRRWRRIDGLGSGDAMLLAAIGAWLGWQALSDVVVIAAISALLFIAVLRRRSARFGERLAFAPWLSLAATLVLLYEHL